MQKYTQQDRSYHRELIWKNAIELFQKRNNMNSKSILRTQRSFINNLDVTGKNSYKTIDVLNNYFKNLNKNLAEQVFWNTVLKKVR